MTSTTLPRRASEHVAKLQQLRQEQLDRLACQPDESDSFAATTIELLDAELALVQTLCAMEQLGAAQATS